MNSLYVLHSSLIFRTEPQLSIRSPHMCFSTFHFGFIASSHHSLSGTTASSLASDIYAPCPPYSDPAYLGSLVTAWLCPIGCLISCKYSLTLYMFSLFYNVLYRIWRSYFSMSSLFLSMTFQSNGSPRCSPYSRPAGYLSSNLSALCSPGSSTVK